MCMRSDQGFELFNTLTYRSIVPFERKPRASRTPGAVAPGAYALNDAPLTFRGRVHRQMMTGATGLPKAAKEVAGILAQLTDGLGLLLQGHVVVALRRVEVLNGVAQRGARHGCGEPVKELQQSVAVSLAGLAHPTADGLVDQVVLVVDEHLGDPERVRRIVLADEVVRGDDGGSSLIHVLGSCKPVQDVAGLVEEVAADHMARLDPPGPRC